MELLKSVRPGWTEYETDALFQVCVVQIGVVPCYECSTPHAIVGVLHADRNQDHNSQIHMFPCVLYDMHVRLFTRENRKVCVFNVAVFPIVVFKNIIADFRSHFHHFALFAGIKSFLHHLMATTFCYVSTTTVRC